MTHSVLTVSTPYASTRVLRFGEGERPLLILPGLSIRSVLLNADAVARAYASFTERFTVYLADRPDPLPPGATLRSIAEDLDRVLTALGIERTDIMGVSQGGMLALYLALDRPARVDRLALCSSAAYVSPAARAVLDRWEALAAALDGDALTEDLMKKLFSPALLRAFGGGDRTPPLTGAEAERFIALAETSARFDLRDRLGEIACPVLALGAQNDAVLGDAVRETADLLGCERYFYPAPYGHGVYDEARDFKQRLLAFFN